ncbi:XRE family transcriptional regulator [Streptomyces luteoverticillatus]|uniref:XRE family transcriptional regulator n=1 Tax=Streptomyces luteoverticillatus TaxID=66425 RepID=A0A3S9PPN1_STRLT|nr:XRE family transcriptional regulator [Streptomyces luteoverticillatus]
MDRSIRPSASASVCTARRTFSHVPSADHLRCRSVAAPPATTLAGDAPDSAHYGRALSRNLERALEVTHQSLRPLAENTGITHSTISRVMHGKVMPDLGTLARLEAASGFQLWPGPTALPSRKSPGRQDPAGRVAPHRRVACPPGAAGCRSASVSGRRAGGVPLSRGCGGRCPGVCWRKMLGPQPAPVRRACVARHMPGTVGGGPASDMGGSFR